MIVKMGGQNGTVNEGLHMIRKKNRGTRIKVLIILINIAPLLFLSCATVPQYKREHLSDPIMLFDEDPEADLMEQHFLPYREGSTGGYGGSGGGCGC